MQDVSVFGLRVQINSSETFPFGFLVSQFADDADPFDSPAIQIRDKAMGINGDLVTWAKATPITLSISIIANTEDDENLSCLFEANRTGRNKFGARDEITMSVGYPDGRIITYTGGVITDGVAGLSASSDGRLKSKTYTFAFENVNRT
jgi:hypothetical protein